MSANEILVGSILFLVSITASFVTVAFLSPVVVRRKVALGDAAKAVLIGSIASLALSLAIGAASDGISGLLASVLCAIGINVFVLSRIVPINESRTLGVKHATFLVLLSGGMNIGLLRALGDVLRVVAGA